MADNTRLIGRVFDNPKCVAQAFVLGFERIHRHFSPFWGCLGDTMVSL